MNKPAAIPPTAITAEIDPVTLATVEQLARERGITGAAFAADAIRRVAEHDVDLLAFVKVGEESIARGDYIEHDAFVAQLRSWRETRVRSS